MVFKRSKADRYNTKDYLEDDVSIGWKIVNFIYTAFKISIFAGLFVGVAVSRQCQGQVTEICRLVGLYD